jgi:pyruvate dehydrogenase E1 component alpha subunit
VVFVCENNLYAMSTPQRYHTNIEYIYERSASYGIPGEKVMGNEILDVYEKVGKAVRRAREGEGPTLLECRTYRKLGHYVGDPEVYRTKEEVLEWERRDPIRLFEAHLLDGIATKTELERMEQQVVEEVDLAVEYAKNSPDPDPKEAMQHVFSDWQWGDEYDRD